MKTVRAKAKSCANVKKRATGPAITSCSTGHDGDARPGDSRPQDSPGHGGASPVSGKQGIKSRRESPRGGDTCCNGSMGHQPPSYSSGVIFIGNH